MRSMRRRGAGQSGRIQNSSTTTSSTKAATSPPGNNQSSSLQRCAQRSSRCANRRDPKRRRVELVRRHFPPTSQLFGFGVTTMNTIGKNENVDHERRRVLSAAAMGIAVAGATNLLPSQMAAAPSGDAIRPFRIDVPEERIVELRKRIAATQWPERETVTDQSQGVQLATIQPLAGYWGTDYDWRKVEARLNALPQFITEIDGLDIHFIHVRSKHENALPMIITHGWPGSVIEQLKIIDPLTNPTAHAGSGADAF